MDGFARAEAGFLQQVQFSIDVHFFAAVFRLFSNCFATDFGLFWSILVYFGDQAVRRKWLAGSTACVELLEK